MLDGTGFFKESPDVFGEVGRDGEDEEGGDADPLSFLWMSAARLRLLEGRPVKRQGCASNRDGPLPRAVTRYRSCEFSCEYGCFPW